MSVYIVAVYDCSLAFGGPEEGGWWYRIGTLVRQTRQFRNKERAYTYSRKLNARLESRTFGPNQGRSDITSVLSDGEYCAEVHQDRCPVGYPEQRPHYE